jgi:hypothetical protein
MCLRISGIPADWKSNTLEQALQQIDSELKLAEVELSELFPACSDSTQVALLTLGRCTQYFKNFGRNEDKLIVIRTDGRKIRLVIDKHFYDLTPMNRPGAPIVAE